MENVMLYQSTIEIQWHLVFLLEMTGVRLEIKLQNPTNTIIDVKRYIGCRYDSNEVQSDIYRYLYEIFDEDGNPKIKINFNNQEMTFAPEEISSMILGKLKQCAEEYFRKTVCNAVITVPAHFKDSQRQATIDAGRIAGLDVRRIINEPTAAALAFRVKEKYESDTEERNILVYDFGGGTFDVSIVTLFSGILDVKSTNGDTHLGRNDLDECLVEYFKNKFETKNNTTIDNPRALRRLRMQCEKVKILLSDEENATIELDELFNNVDFYCGITRQEFENICEEKIKKTLTLVGQALSDADLERTKIDEILLIGGSTRIPLVRKLLKEFFDGKELNTSLDPDLAVSIGAAIQAAILDGDENHTTGTLLLLDVVPLSLGIETAGELMVTLIPRNSPIPAKVTRKFCNEKDYQLKVIISVYEGERTMVKDNNKIGEFLMSRITPRIRGQTHINVTFEVNTDGILLMTAEEITEEGLNNMISVLVDKGRLSENEILRMISTAQKLQKDDEEKRKIIHARIYLESFCIDTKHKAKKVVNNSTDCDLIVNKCDEVLEWIKEQRAQTKEGYEKKKNDTNEFIRPILIKYL